MTSTDPVTQPPVSEPMLQDAGDYAQAYTVAFIAAKANKHEVVGTGVLLKIFSEHCIVTAGHLVSRMRRAENGVRLYAVNPSSCQLIALDGVEWGAVDSAACDVGVVWLPFALGVSLSGRAGSLDLDQLDTDDALGEGTRCFVCGSPTALYSPDVRKIRFLRFLTRSRGDECMQHYDPSTDIILSFRRGKQEWDGVELSELSPEGMSGCGIWRVYRAGCEQTWKPSDIRLVGVQCAWRKEAQLLRGTRILHALRLAAEMKPDLSTLIQQHHPSAKRPPAP